MLFSIVSFSAQAQRGNQSKMQSIFRFKSHLLLVDLPAECDWDTAQMAVAKILNVSPTRVGFFPNGVPLGDNSASLSELDKDTDLVVLVKDTDYNTKGYHNSMRFARLYAKAHPIPPSMVSKKRKRYSHANVVSDLTAVIGHESASLHNHIEAGRDEVKDMKSDVQNLCEILKRRPAAASVIDATGADASGAIAAASVIDAKDAPLIDAKDAAASDAKAASAIDGATASVIEDAAASDAKATSAIDGASVIDAAKAAAAIDGATASVAERTAEPAEKAAEPAAEPESTAESAPGSMACGSESWGTRESRQQFGRGEVTVYIPPADAAESQDEVDQGQQAQSESDSSSEGEGGESEGGESEGGESEATELPSDDDGVWDSEMKRFKKPVKSTMIAAADVNPAASVIAKPGAAEDPDIGSASVIAEPGSANDLDIAPGSASVIARPDAATAFTITPESSEEAIGFAFTATVQKTVFWPASPEEFSEAPDGKRLRLYEQLHQSYITMTHRAYELTAERDIERAHLQAVTNRLAAENRQ